MEIALLRPPHAYHPLLRQQTSVRPGNIKRRHVWLFGAGHAGLRRCLRQDAMFGSSAQGALGRADFYAKMLCLFFCAGRAGSRLMMLPSASGRLLLLPGASWRLLVLPGASWRSLALPGASWCFLALPGAS